VNQRSSGFGEHLIDAITSARSRSKRSVSHEAIDLPIMGSSSLLALNVLSSMGYANECRKSRIVTR
jgi:hypothetical protein